MLSSRAGVVQSAIFQWSTDSAGREFRTTYNLGCKGVLHVQATPKEGVADSESYSRSFFPLGGNGRPIQIHVLRGGGLKISFSNGDEMIRKPPEWAPDSGGCFSEQRLPIRREARTNGKIKYFSSINYVCDGAILEMEAIDYPNDKAYAMVYAKKCGGMGHHVRLEAKDLARVVETHDKRGKLLTKKATTFLPTSMRP